jgi:hypothetical protein
MHRAIVSTALAQAISNYKRGDRRLLKNEDEMYEATEALLVMLQDVNLPAVLAKLGEVPDGQHRTRL